VHKLACSILIAACSRPPQTAGVPHAKLVTASSQPPNAAPPPPVPHTSVSHVWVGFTAKPFDPGGTPSSPLEEMPDWEFSSDLPAIDRDATRVYVAEATSSGLATAPNFRVTTISVADDRTLDTTRMLDQREVVAATLDGTVQERRRALASLASLVQERVDKENALLDASDLTKLLSCTLEGAYSTQPPCSMEQQPIVCGATKIVYASQTLVFRGPNGENRRGFPKWKPKPERRNGGVEMPVRECFLSVYADEKRRLFLGQLVYECQGGGDWCGTPSEWHAVRW
jgi:hypothetical protein